MLLLLLLLSLLFSDFFLKENSQSSKWQGAPSDAGVYETLKLICEFTKALCVASRERILDFSNFLKELW
jgi:hypothetical protein